MWIWHSQHNSREPYQFLTSNLFRKDWTQELLFEYEIQKWFFPSMSNVIWNDGNAPSGEASYLVCHFLFLSSSDVNSSPAQTVPPRLCALVLDAWANLEVSETEWMVCVSLFSMTGQNLMQVMSWAVLGQGFPAVLLCCVFKEIYILLIKLPNSSSGGD